MNEIEEFALAAVEANDDADGATFQAVVEHYNEDDAVVGYHRSTLLIALYNLATEGEIAVTSYGRIRRT